MVDRDLVLAKINNIQNCLKRIDQTVENKEVWNYDTQDIVILNLQRAIQASIDIAAHIVADEKLGLSTSLKDLFGCLEKNGVLSQTISDKMKKMVGFRNIAVHDYQDIDVAILRAVVAHHLKDFEDFYDEILKHCKK